MELKVFQDTSEMGRAAGLFCEEAINRALRKKGSARIVLSTGNSQLSTIRNIIRAAVDWSKVEMFHLDEYIGLPESHPASFRKYLKDEFIRHVGLKRAYLVDGEGDVGPKVEELSAELLKAPVDLALIGIGENAHIAFNDPPADFEERAPYKVVKLSDTCKRQQVGEGWFASPADVPEYAISMSVHQIIQSNTILSCVPYQVKAQAVRSTLNNELTNRIPATILKTHPDWYLYLDKESASLLDDSQVSFGMGGRTGEMK